MEKVRIHKLAKDIGETSKDIVALLEEYNIKNKNYMSILSEFELDIILEHYTQLHQVPDLLSIFGGVFGESDESSNRKGDVIDDKVENDDVKVELDAPEMVLGRDREDEKVLLDAEFEALDLNLNQRHVNIKVDTVDLERIEAEDRVEELVPENIENIQKKQKIKKGSQRRNLDKSNVDIVKLDASKESKRKREKFEVLIPDEITVMELADRLDKDPISIVKSLFELGIVVSITQTVDFDIASLIAEDAGAVVKKEIVVTQEDRLFNDIEDLPKNLKKRPPVVVVMGHVDHGKTSLLDAIRDADVVAGEYGGITQHIGAYRVRIKDEKITILDTPGHEAFTAMRARGALITDIAILVIAADDGIKPQTIEAIDHAKAAGVSVIVAINKMDKEGANPERVKQSLTEYGLVPEEWGGQTICVEVSAYNKTGIDHLLEMVLLLAEMKELKANPDRAAKGTAIEAKLDKNKGPIATLLVQNGTLNLGDVLVVGTTIGRVRAMVDDNGKSVKKAGPSVPVEILGLDQTPECGDLFYAVSDEKKARQVVQERRLKVRQDLHSLHKQVSLDNLFSKIEEGKIQNLNVVLKGDVQGSVEAIRQLLEKAGNDDVRVKIIHGAVGAITESDVMLASASDAIVIGFNVRPTAVAAGDAKQQGVDIRTYRVIYDAIDDIRLAIKGMIAPKFRESINGHLEVRFIYKISGVGTVGGSYVLDGKVQRSDSVRIVRDGIVIYEGKIASLKRFKDDMREVAQGYECGIAIEKYNDIKEGDIIEAYAMEEFRED